jgi:biopolymer transport protein ExbD
MKEHPENKAPRLTRAGILVAAVILTVGMVSLVFSQASKGRSVTADPSSNAEKRKPTAQQLARPVINDDRVYVAERNIKVDAKTGRLRKPTSEETKELVASLKSLTNRSTEGLTAATHADGTRQVNLRGRFGNVMIARPNADGTTETTCVTTFEEAAAFLGLRPETESETSARKAAQKTNQ